MFKAYGSNDNLESKELNLTSNQNFESYSTGESIENRINDYIESDSSSESYKYSSKKRLSKRRRKLKKDIVKRYLNELPNIEDEKCQYRKWTFQRDAPRDDRSETFFLDKQGNRHLLRYGCIYEKHIPKYKSQKSLDSKQIKKQRENRYFNKLKTLLTRKNQLKCCVIRKKCREGEKCCCEQDFIPLPFDVDIKKTNMEVVDDNEFDMILLDKVTELNKEVFNNPQNVEAWLELVQLQDEAAQLGFDKKNSVRSNVSVAEKKLCILDKGIINNNSNIDLQICRMSVGELLWLPDKLEKEWDRVLFLYGHSLPLWKAFIEYTKRPLPGLTVDRTLSAYGRCFCNFYNIMSGRNKARTIHPDDISELCELLAQLCDFLAYSGYVERATAIWQANIEFNLMSPPNLIPSDSGGLTDDPIYQQFSNFWNSTQPKIGQPNCKGWVNSSSCGNNQDPNNWFFNQQMAATITNNDDLVATIEGFIKTTESHLIDPAITPTNQPIHATWLHLETTRSLGWWLPTSNYSNEDDPHRSIPFSLIKSFLLTLHDPRNLTEPQLYDKSALHKQLLMLFLQYLDIYPLSNYSQLPYYRHNLLYQHLCCLHQLDIKRHGIPRFVHITLDLLRPIQPLAVAQLELSYHFTMCLHADNWKQAFTSIKQASKRIFQQYPDQLDLWISYALLLTNLHRHPLFASNQKSKQKQVIDNELTKVSLGLLYKLKDSDHLSLRSKLLVIYIGYCSIYQKYTYDKVQQNDKDVLDEIEKISTGIVDILSILYPQCRIPIDHKKFQSILEFLNDVFDYLINSGWNEHTWYLLLTFYSFYFLLTNGIDNYLIWSKTRMIDIMLKFGSSCQWSSEFLNQASQYLDRTIKLIQWFLIGQSVNINAILRSFLTPVIDKFVDIQSNFKQPLLDTIFTPNILEYCITKSTNCGNMMPLRNFLWRVVTSSQSQQFLLNQGGLASILIPISMELSQYESAVQANGIATEFLLERIERIRSSFGRSVNVSGVYWRYRLGLYLSWMRFEGMDNRFVQIDKSDREERVKKVFYQAVTELPTCKSLYLAGVSLVPDLLNEAVQMMKDKRVRLCATLEEVTLLRRIRDSQSTADKSLV